MTERTHHSASPSSLKRISLCPGSLALSKKAPRLPQNVYAIEGQMLHDHVHPDKDISNLTDEHTTLINQCRTCLDHYRDLQLKEGDEILFEQKLELPDFVTETDFFGEPIRSNKIISYGYGDVIVLRKKIVSILDWKFGRSPVDPPGQNLQMLAYGVMAALRWQRQHAQIVVYQPRVSKTANYFDLKNQNIQAVWKDIARIISLANEPDAPLNPSEDACRYCPALTICPAVEQSTALVRNITDPKEITDPAKIAMLLTAARILSKKCDQIEAQAKELAKDGGILKDATGKVVYQMTKTASGAMVIKDVNQCFERIAHYFEIDFFLRNFVKIGSPASLRETFAKRHKARTGEKLEEGRQAWEDLMTGETDPNPSITNLITHQADRMRLELKKQEEE